MCGFGNALSFKNIREEDINIVEKFIQEETLEILSTKLSDTIGTNDVVIGDEMLHSYFGEIFASQPNKFHFQRGDILLIEELVEHVKRVVDNDGKINSGLNKFKNKSKRKITEKINKKKLDSELDECENSSFKSDLFNKVVECLKSQIIEKKIANLNLDALDESIVKVYTNNGIPTYGEVTCILCTKSNKKSCDKLIRPKRVYYHTGRGGKYWVLSNFSKHLTKIHKISNDNFEGNGLQQNNGDHEKSTQKLIEPIEVENINEESVICVAEVDDNKQTIISTEMQINQISSIYSQLSHQVNEMTTAVLVNGDTQGSMQFRSNEFTKETLTVAIIEGNGNCCFSALAHQLFREPIQSKEHKAATKKLRKDVVQHILDPQNYTLFEHALKGHIYELKDPKNINDINFECKFFVTNCLSRSGTWAGAETIKAVSDLYRVNIIIFNEEETGVFIHNNRQKYDRTIAIAFRTSTMCDNEGNAIRNHYDSVCDINSTGLYDAIESISQQLQ